MLCGQSKHFNLCLVAVYKMDLNSFELTCCKGHGRLVHLVVGGSGAQHRLVKVWADKQKKVGVHTFTLQEGNVALTLRRNAGTGWLEGSLSLLYTALFALRVLPCFIRWHY